MSLPPDPENMNDGRADWAAAALDTFKRQTGTDHEDALLDLLVDLMHLADRDPRLGGFARQLERARANYADETAPTPEDPA